MPDENASAATTPMNCFPSTVLPHAIDSRTTNSLLFRSRFRRVRNSPGRRIEARGPPDQCLPVRKHNLQELPDRCAVLGGSHSNSYFIPRLKGMQGPAALDHVSRVANFNCPVCDVTLFVRRIVLHKAMWIGPQPLPHGSLHGQLLIHVVACRSVMRRQRN